MSEEQTDGEGRLEILITIGLGLAAVLTALCVYLIDVHDDKALLAFNSGVANTTEATGSFVGAAQKRSADEALFLEFASRSFIGDQGDPSSTALAKYIQTAIMDEDLQAAVEWWAANQVNGDPPTPFVEENPEFVEPQREEADAQTATAADDFETAQDEQEIGDTYILAQIIVAISLFLFGVAGVTRSHQMKLRTTVMGYVVFVVSLGVVVFG